MSNKQREALEAALNCIELTGPDSAEAANRQADVIVLLRKALAKPEQKQEPYAFALFDFEGGHDLFLMENNKDLYAKNKFISTLLYTSPQHF